MTTVSIITPTYNPTFEQFMLSKNSIEAQTDKDFEWILVDDGSSNYNGWADVVLGKNYGASVARNAGFQISSGDIITYLDMGDELHPDRVKNIIDIFGKYDIEILFSAYDIVQNEQVRRYDHLENIGSHPSIPTAFEYVQLFQTQNLCIPLGVAHKRKPFVEVGGFQRGIVCGEDGILWRRMLDKVPRNKVLFSNDFAGTYYVSQTGQSRTQRRPEMGGFAFDGDKRDNGRYLDAQWFAEYNSKGLYDGN